MHHAYLFEARGIQRFLFASGKLRDMLAGSELLDHVCADKGLLDTVLTALQLAPAAVPRRAGGTFYLVFSTRGDAERFTAAWRLAFAQWVPGVEHVDALEGGETIQQAIRAGILALARRRNRLQPGLPSAGPLTERSPRTGLAAVSRDRGESLDHATTRLRHFTRPKGGVALAQRFLDQTDCHWPRNFEHEGPAESRFPLLRQRLIGLVHADGNAIGKVLRVLNEATAEASDADYVTVYRQFSDQLVQVTQSAARSACSQVLLPRINQHNVLPARPLVLGGDDMTIIVRADLALPFTREYLQAFERESETAMMALRGLLETHGLVQGAQQLPQRLTASAGICFIKPSYPFQSAHELAESLCGRAKTAARESVGADTVPPATIAFHRVESAVAEDADALFERAHCMQADGTTYHLALRAYALTEGAGLPVLGDLEALAATFADTEPSAFNDRPLRTLATLWRQDIHVARHAYRRWRQLAERGNRQRLQQFDACLDRLVGSVDTKLPASQGKPAQSPLSDLLLWRSLHADSHQEGGRA